MLLSSVEAAQCPCSYVVAAQRPCLIGVLVRMRLCPCSYVEAAQCPCC